MSDAHIVALPSFVFILRIVTIVLSIIVLGLAAFALDLTKSDLGISNSNSGSGSGSVNNVDLSGWGIGKREWRNYNPFLNGDNVAFFIFCCVWTWLVEAYVILTPLFLQIAYNMWGHLAAEILLCVFWLCGFAALGATVSDTSDYYSQVHKEISHSNGADVSDLKKIYSKWQSAAAATGLGAIIWILVTITVVVFCIRLHKHRTSNPDLNAFGLAEKGQTHEMGNVQQAPLPQQQIPQQYPQPTETPVQYTSPPPQQWQQSPPPNPPQGQQQY